MDCLRYTVGHFGSISMVFALWSYAVHGDDCVDYCLQGTKCVTEKPISCVCLDGRKDYKEYNNGSGSCLGDKNECIANVLYDCSENSVCENTIGSYICSCLSGFAKEGNDCNDEDECMSDPCMTNAKCTNSQGSYTCLCDLGYEKNITGHCSPESEHSLVNNTTKIVVGITCTIGAAFFVVILARLVCWIRSHQNETPEVSLQYRVGSQTLSLETATAPHGQIEVQYAVPDTTTSSGSNRSVERIMEGMNNQFRSTAHHLSSVAHIKNATESPYSNRMICKNESVRNEELPQMTADYPNGPNIDRGDNNSCVCLTMETPSTNPASRELMMHVWQPSEYDHLWTWMKAVNVPDFHCQPGLSRVFEYEPKVPISVALRNSRNYYNNDPVGHTGMVPPSREPDVA